MFHRVDDLESMPAPRFLEFARRLTHYDGAVLAAARRQEPRDEPAGYRSVVAAIAPPADVDALKRRSGSGWEDAPGVPAAFAYGMPTAADLGLPSE